MIFSGYEVPIIIPIFIYYFFVPPYKDLNCKPSKTLALRFHLLLLGIFTPLVLLLNQINTGSKCNNKKLHGYKGVKMGFSHHFFPVFSYKKFFAPLKEKV